MQIASRARYSCHLWAHPIRIAATSLFLVAVCACGNLTQVTNNTITQPTQFDTPQGAVERWAGAVRDFTNAYALQALYSGLLTDELSSAEPDPFVDQRAITGQLESTTNTYPYAQLAQARLEAIRAVQSLRTYNPNPSDRIGLLYVYTAYAELFYSENMCSGIPLATLSNGRPVPGGIVSRGDLVRRALSHFDSAATNETDTTGAKDDTLATLISVGRARALLDSGDFAGASTAAAAVPASFVYTPPFDGVNQNNAIYAFAVNSNGGYVSDAEGINGLNFVTASDARVPIQNFGTATDGNPEYLPASYSSLAAPIVMASGVEAQLIQAEAAWQAGNLAQWSAILNALRQTAITPAMDSLPSDSTIGASAATQVEVMFRERAFWLFLTGHRHEDMRRLVRQYGRNQNAVFPTGPYHQSGSYGSSVTFPPFGESSAYTGCTNSGA
jgi:starch-binding outer membrane protein, SusD/RagB family